MSTKRFVKAARDLCIKHEQRAVIVISLSDQCIEAAAWARSGMEQIVAESICSKCLTVIGRELQGEQAADPQDTASISPSMTLVK